MKKKPWLEVESKIVPATYAGTLKLVCGLVNCFVLGGPEKMFDELNPRGYLINLRLSNVGIRRDGGAGSRSTITGKGFMLRK